MEPRRRFRLATILAFCMLARAVAVAQVSDLSDARRVALSGQARTKAIHVLSAARARLASPECQQVLTDFVDDRGRTLTTALGESGRTAQEHLDLLYLAEGNVAPQCLDRKRLAFTTPHSRVVFICGQVFESYVTQNPTGAEILLIHEFLHTLGLGENPPSTSEISDRVAARCGDAARHANRRTPRD